MTVNSGLDQDIDDIDCRRAVDVMSDYLDGRLEGADRARLERHLADCPYCVEYLAQLRVTIDALGRAQPADLSDHALNQLVHVYRTWKQ